MIAGLSSGSVMGLLRFLFGFRGRIGRRQFLAGAAFWLAVVAAAFGLLVKAPWFAASHFAAVIAVAAISSAALQTKRFHDRNRSGWRVIVFGVLVLVSPILPVMIVPLLVLCIEHLVELMIIAGTAG